ncbi:hypothetical protein D3C76_1650940 [compost metagenome]
MEIEQLEPGHHYVAQPMGEHGLESVNYHIHLLEHAGLVECVEYQPGSGEPGRVASALTLIGHDLLDSIRDEDTWRAKKSILLARLGVISYDALRKSA